MKVSELNIGDRAKVTGYAQADPAYRHKLLRMGLTRGIEFRLVRKAPMGDPVEVELRGFNLTLRAVEADALEIEVVVRADSPRKGWGRMARRFRRRARRRRCEEP